MKTAAIIAAVAVVAYIAYRKLIAPAAAATGLVASPFVGVTRGYDIATAGPLVFMNGGK